VFGSSPRRLPAELVVVKSWYIFPPNKWFYSGLVNSPLVTGSCLLFSWRVAMHLFPVSHRFCLRCSTDKYVITLQIVPTDNSALSRPRHFIIRITVTGRETMQLLNAIHKSISSLAPMSSNVSSVSTVCFLSGFLSILYFQLPDQVVHTLYT